MYNTILRKFPKDLYDKFSGADNLFSTTIFVLASAVLKVSRAIRIPACCKRQCMHGVGIEIAVTSGYNATITGNASLCCAFAPAQQGMFVCGRAATLTALFGASHFQGTKKLSLHRCPG